MNNILFNEYESLSPLGEGGYAVVWKVRHIKYGYIRALKILNGFIENDNDLKYVRFLKECQFLLRIGNGGHNNIVRVAQPKLLDHRAMVEMEYINGTDLHNYITKECKGFLPYREVESLLRDMASALAYCHYDIYEFCYDPNVDDIEKKLPGGSVEFVPRDRRQLVEKYKVIHNDIHSSNIRRRSYDGNYVLLDFGLALTDNLGANSSSRQKGDPKYKAPEKFKDDNIITEQSDIYSFGILMYEALTGSVPFNSKTSSNSFQNEYDIMLKHQKEPPPPIEPARRKAFEALNPNLVWKKDYPDWLEKVVLRCLKKDPKDRYQNGKELFEAIKAELGKQKSVDSGELLEKYETLKKEHDSISAALVNYQTYNAAMQETLAKQKEELDRRAAQPDDENKDIRDRVQLLTEYEASLKHNLEHLQTIESLIKEKADLYTTIKNLNKEKKEGKWDEELYKSRQKLKISNKAIIVLLVLLFVARASSGYLYNLYRNEKQLQKQKKEAVNEAGGTDATDPNGSSTAGSGTDL